MSAQEPSGQKVESAPTVPESGQNDSPAEVKSQISIEEYKNLEARLEGQSRVIGKLQGDLEKVMRTKESAPPVQETKAAEPNERDIVQKQLQEKLAIIEQREKKMREKAKADGVRNALIVAGADESRVQMAVDSILYRHGNQLKVDDSGADYQVEFEESNGAVWSIGEWAASYMKDAGKALLAEKRTPSDVGGNRTPEKNRGKTPVSIVEWQTKLTKDQRESGDFVINT